MRQVASGGRPDRSGVFCAFPSMWHFQLPLSLGDETDADHYFDRPPSATLVGRLGRGESLRANGPCPHCGCVVDHPPESRLRLPSRTRLCPRACRRARSREATLSRWRRDGVQVRIVIPARPCTSVVQGTTGYLCLVPSAVLDRETGSDIGEAPPALGRSPTPESEAPPRAVARCRRAPARDGGGRGRPGGRHGVHHP